MDINSPEVKKLIKTCEVFQQEFELFILSFVSWKRLFDKKDIENHAHSIIRTMFFRECILSITRIWETPERNKLSLSMFRIKEYMKDKRITDVLIKHNEQHLRTYIHKMDLLSGLLSYEKTMSDSNNRIIANFDKIVSTIELYEGDRKSHLDKIRNVRDNLIAHRNIKATPNPEDLIKIITSIYNHTSIILTNLMGVLCYEIWDICKIEDLYRQLPIIPES